MAFPTLKPTGREFNPGDWPIKRYNAQSGAEIRILYGNRRTNATLSLSYDNITDANAQLFTADYEAQLGTFRTFTLPSDVRAGWTGSAATIDAPPSARWRYDSAPVIQAVRPGRSSVTVSLVAVI
jgi:hypothetical protein